MPGRTDWPAAFAVLDDKKTYTLQDLVKIIRAEGYKSTGSQAIYHWIRRHDVPKRGMITSHTSGQNLLVWRGSDLKNAFYEIAKK